MQAERINFAGTGQHIGERKGPEGLGRTYPLLFEILLRKLQQDDTVHRLDGGLTGASDSSGHKFEWWEEPPR